MKIAIRYFTKTGNTKKLAEAISEVVKVPALNAKDNPITEDIDILFLGSSVMATKLRRQVKDYINTFDTKIGLIVNFSIGGLIESTYKPVKKLIQNKGYNMAPEEFHSIGQMWKFNKGHPNKEEIKAAKAFSKSILKKYSTVEK